MNYIQQKKRLNRRKIILLHPTKTGGTSLKVSLNVLHKHHLMLNSWVIPKDSIIITTVRNPYDRVISMYNHFGHTLKDNFNDFVDLVIASNAIIFQPQYKYLHKESNIIRIESFEKDFNDFCDKYDIKGELKKANISSRKLVEELSEENKEKIYGKYKKDFELLNYLK